MVLQCSMTYDVGPLLGLRTVLLSGLEMEVCPQCDAKLLPGTYLDKVHLNMVQEIRGKETLEGSEIRFLRKACGYSRNTLATYLGVSVHDVDAWEINERPMPQQLQRSLQASPGC